MEKDHKTPWCWYAAFSALQIKKNDENMDFLRFWVFLILELAFPALTWSPQVPGKQGHEPVCQLLIDFSLIAEAK